MRGTMRTLGIAAAFVALAGCGRSTGIFAQPATRGAVMFDRSLGTSIGGLGAFAPAASPGFAQTEPSNTESFAHLDENGFRRVADEPLSTFSAAVASFGMLLRGSQYAGTASVDAVTELAEEGFGADPGGYRREFVGLVRRSRGLADR